MGHARLIRAACALLLATAAAAHPAHAQEEEPFIPESLPIPEPPRPPKASAGAPEMPEPFFSGIFAEFSNYTTRFCSQAEKDLYVKEGETELAEINKRADAARAYLLTMRQRIAASRTARPADAAADDAALRFFSKERLNKMTVEQPREAEAALDRVKNAPVVDCSTGGAIERFRPVLEPVEPPPIPERVCTQAELEALRARALAAYDAVQRNVAKVRAYQQELMRLRQFASREGGDRALVERLIAEARAYKVEADKVELARQAASSALYRAEQLKVSPCDDAPAPGVPPRPMLTPVEYPAPPPFCDEAARNAYLKNVIDPEIAKADANVKAANEHAEYLEKLFNDAAMFDDSVARQEALKAELEAYKPIVQQAYQQAVKARQARDAALRAPLTQPCPTDAPTPVPPPDGPRATPGGGGGGANRPCPPKRGKAPIKVGSNAKVGSGARATKKALSTLTGLAGNLLGGGGGGGGGGGKGGPRLADCKLKDSEKTVFTDPLTGISLRVGAKRSGDNVTVFAEVEKSPDKGTFQGAWMGTPDGGLRAPASAGICDLWGEWTLTVSWTKTTYVDGQVVSRESGGYQDKGVFSLPGMVSSDANPQGLWKQLGFSNASHGAREVALQYRLPPGGSGPVELILHVTRPSQDPVVTQPFVLAMSEGPNGFSFAQATEDDCPPEAAAAGAR